VKQTLAVAVALLAAPQEEGFVSLFNGKDLSGWKVSENPASARVEDGKIVTNGPRAHVFYAGDVKNHVFKNFEFKADVLIKPGSNAGIYFHTEYQDKGWPEKGFEAQVCSNGYKDPRKTGSLYGIKDLAESPVKDDEWFEYHILVKGKKVEIRLNGKTVNEWTQPDDYAPKQFKGRVLGSGTFALQCHDPGSTVYFKNLRVKPLDD
jgi:hypothetical protein